MGIAQQLKRLWPSCVASSTHRPSPIVFLIIQGDSGGEIIVLRDDCIGHCEEKSLYEHVSFLIGYRDRAV